MNVFSRTKKGIALIIVILTLPLSVFDHYLALYAIIGFVAGTILRKLYQSYRSKKSQTKFSTEIKVGFWFIIAIAVLGIVLELLGEVPFLKRRLPPTINYKGYVRYLPESKDWSIEETIIIPKECIKNGDIGLLKDKGWAKVTVIDQKVFTFTRRDIKQAVRKWYRPYLINSITIANDVCTIELAEFDEKSKVIMYTPIYMVAKTFPKISTREDMLKDNQEELTIELSSKRVKDFVFRIKVYNPIIHNRILKVYFKILFLEPLKYLVVFLFGIFCQSIAEVTLIPRIKKWLPFNKLPTDESDSDSVDNDQPTQT